MEKNYLCVKINNNQIKSYEIPKAYSTFPYICVNKKGYIPLSTKTEHNSDELRFKINNNIYGIGKTFTYTSSSTNSCTSLRTETYLSTNSYSQSATKYDATTTATYRNTRNRAYSTGADAKFALSTYLYAYNLADTRVFSTSSISSTNSNYEPIFSVEKDLLVSKSVTSNSYYYTYSYVKPNVTAYATSSEMRSFSKIGTITYSQYSMQYYTTYQIDLDDVIPPSYNAGGLQKMTYYYNNSRKGSYIYPFTVSDKDNFRMAEFYRRTTGYSTYNNTFHNSGMPKLFVYLDYSLSTCSYTYTSISSKTLTNSFTDSITQTIIDTITDM